MSPTHEIEAHLLTSMITWRSCLIFHDSRFCYKFQSYNFMWEQIFSIGFKDSVFNWYHKRLYIKINLCKETLFMINLLITITKILLLTKKIKLIFPQTSCMNMVYECPFIIHLKTKNKFVKFLFLLVKILILYV